MRSGPASGRGWRGVVGEGLLVVLVLVVFTRLHAAVGTDVAAADAHALTLQSLEEGLHLDVEVATNQWLTDHPALIGPAVLAYRLYYAAVVGVLVWLYLRRPEVYVPVRRVAVAMTGLALLVFWVLPMAPPRFALPGIVDV
ncbi:MAG: phosphatase PAP2 family protein, partial [Actinomycetota bacterium]|nr:phosphatase PAP2 family protein [Actinomycetota bacterium]